MLRATAGALQVLRGATPSLGADGWVVSADIKPRDSPVNPAAQHRARLMFATKRVPQVAKKGSARLLRPRVTCVMEHASTHYGTLQLGAKLPGSRAGPCAL